VCCTVVIAAMQVGTGIYGKTMSLADHYQTTEMIVH
jgi:hypothetical protein